MTKSLGEGSSSLNTSKIFTSDNQARVPRTQHTKWVSTAPKMGPNTPEISLNIFKMGLNTKLVSTPRVHTKTIAQHLVFFR